LIKLQRTAPFLFALLIWAGVHSSGNAQSDTIYQISNAPQLLTGIELRQKLDLVKNNEANPSEWIARFVVAQEELRGDTLLQRGAVHLMPIDMIDPNQLVAERLNRPLPNFKFTDLDGNQITNTALKGQVTVINFWFTRCPPCIIEMPYLNQLKEEYVDQPIRFISFAPENTEQLNLFLKRFDFNFQHLPDAKQFIKQFGVGYPKNIILDRDGIVRYIGGGIVRKASADIPLSEGHELNWDGLRGKIQELLESE